MIHRLRLDCLMSAGILILAAALLPSARVVLASPPESLPAEDRLITLSVQNIPLSGVLEKIAAATGLTFDIDEQWQDTPVSVTLDKIPLEKALQRILVNLNNVVIYHSTNQVKIVVFGKAEPAGAAGSPGRPPAYTPPPPPPPEESPPVEEELEPEDRPEAEETADETPDQDQDGEGETQARDAASDARQEPTAEGGSPGEGRSAEQQLE
jgi:hypothetical protein